MATETPYQKAERKIAEALRSGATKLDLSCKWNAKDSEKLTELPESLGQLTQLQSLNLDSNQWNPKTYFHKPYVLTPWCECENHMHRHDAGQVLFPTDREGWAKTAPVIARGT